MSNKIKIKRVIISVFDKTKILKLSNFLISQNIEIYSTGGTYNFLKENNIKVKEVSDYTKSPEILGGRVKTLHPKIHGGILAERNSSEHLKEIKKNKIHLIDLVVVNLYPFKKTVSVNSSIKKCVENIDIGGPTMIRAAAKNYKFVTTIITPDDYEMIIDEMKKNKNTITKKTRLKLATKAFNEIFLYDMDIRDWFAKIEKKKNENFFIQSKLIKNLRYGENPKQKASIYQDTSIKGKDNLFFNMNIIQGKEISYNNINDIQEGCLLTDEINDSCVTIIKHANPSGVCKDKNLITAYKKALACDPVSAFGGIIVINGKINKILAKEISKQFAEIVVGKQIDEDAKKVFANKKKLILIELRSFKSLRPKQEIKSLSNIFLIQTPDNICAKKNDLKFVTKKKANNSMINDLLFAEKVCKYVKSNAIVYVKNNATLGIGAGQMNRLDSAKIGSQKAKEFFNKNVLKGSIVASDAFFPFPDSIDIFGKIGVKAIIQPGGSIKDHDVIKRANKYNIAMVFTNMRHFKH